MKTLRKTGLATIIAAVFMVTPMTYAATSPSLGVANPYSILSSSYINTAIGTVLNGDLGYTTGPAVAPSVNGQTHVADSTYNQAGIDQGVALAALNSQPCTFSFTTGAIDLATDTTHGTVGVYAPGVYCITGAASIGGGGTITLTGSGTYIFRVAGALTTSANSIVALAGGASACNVWWTPTSATTLGANSTFVGTDIDASGITIGSTITWAGRALAFGGTVSTTTDTINTVPLCSAASAASSSSSGLGASSGAPGLPNTGGSARNSNTAVWTISAVVVSLVAATYVLRKKLHLSSNR